MKIALKITPQRSTQYTNMTSALALPELLASPLGTVVHDVEHITLAGQGYLLATANEDILASPFYRSVLSQLGATSEVYEYFAQLGEVQGPLLRPVEPSFVPFVPREMVETRRYKGKTNELFTHVLLNAALFAGAYREQITERLRILDPLAGGGTTLFMALAAGYDAFGIEIVRQDVETTAVFVKQFCNSEHILYKEIDERGRKAGRRYQFEIGHKGNTRWLVLAQGDSVQADLHMREVAGGPRMHAIIADVPYGIQHFGEISGLLAKALPVWERLLFPGGTIALAWNATRIERAEMVAFIEDNTRLYVRNDAPYMQFAHTVDRVIKRRDIVVAVRQ